MGEQGWQDGAAAARGIQDLLDGDQLVVSVDGYTDGLDPQDGREKWSNPLKGMGTGIPCLASIYGSTSTAQTACYDALRRKESGS